MQEKQIHSLLKTLLIPLVFMVSLGSAHACSPAFGAKAASIAEKADTSTYVFDGVITQITETYIKVNVQQYFKGMGLSEVKIEYLSPANSCQDQYRLNQRALFFTEGNLNQPLKLVYDGAFGSSREMSAKNFTAITNATKCMATYDNGVLVVPCIAHQDSLTKYHAELHTIASPDGSLTLSTGLTIPITDIKALATVSEVKSAGTGAPSHPNTHYFTVKGMFSSGCGRLGSISTSRVGADFTVMILQDSRIGVCSMALVSFEKKIALDLTGLAFLDYTINVNNAVKTTFQYESEEPIIIFN